MRSGWAHQSFVDRGACSDCTSKDEGLNPTGSFKARGMTCCFSRQTARRECFGGSHSLQRRRGARSLCRGRGAPCGHRDARGHPCGQRDGVPGVWRQSIKLNGLISDCGKYVAERKDREGWYDVYTLKGPYLIEGKKTMGYELWEQFGRKLPDVIFYPTGGGVGLIGMCKAFDEMQEMGWIGADRPRMVVVQAQGCAPIVRAWEAHQNSAAFFQNAATIASGLRVPGPLGDVLILNMLRQTKGTALTVTDEEMLQAGRELAALEGAFAAPEGAATVIATRKLAASGWIQPQETVVLFNTGTGYKYTEVWQRALQ